ncbi:MULTISPECIES: DUF1292 domain-containing protein [Thermobacillus]|uniref:DUF1292 domain-containing protein n=1 Tax=Thermobacillus composti (strain DSM 18247 / JCM 13945 / KWC4) TaxID=717605 RepID=L0EG33_THECK|nr:MULTISPECIES: DUF1292 domain-containing protein [Thermobacillus]AGA58589.1 Protein of unknown function (DUF1292) [Thermobacillus composti KWC4]
MMRIERLNRLKETYGREIELIDGEGGTETFELLAEYRVGDAVYAALQTPDMRRNDEIAFFRVETRDDGSFELADIEDEDEWETAAEGYDELIFEESAGDRGSLE